MAYVIAFIIAFAVSIKIALSRSDIKAEGLAFVVIAYLLMALMIYLSTILIPLV